MSVVTEARIVGMRREHPEWGLARALGEPSATMTVPRPSD